MKQGEGEQMSVMGAQLRFLCAADKTERQWSLMEVVLPEHSGPPPHDRRNRTADADTRRSHAP